MIVIEKKTGQRYIVTGVSELRDGTPAYEVRKVLKAPASFLIAQDAVTVTDESMEDAEGQREPGYSWLAP